jgi:galactofuranosylgalactofuranosylrhamnosyl-N-acetylglucosaminyl-diphospho-decaprenol beta-1,5/1,6-galactofuranosyltransferase
MTGAGLDKEWHMDDLAPFGLLPDRSAARATGLVLQRLHFGQDTSLRDLYLRAANDEASSPTGCRIEETRLLLARNAAVSFDTYFGAFFERSWRDPTSLASLVLDLYASGSFALRILRRTAHGEEVLLHEALLSGFKGRLSVPLPAPLISASGGRLFAEITALRGGCRVTALEWRTPDTPIPAPVGLVPVFCTFGRERQLGALLASLAAAPDCWRDLPSIVIVNQGKPGLAAHPALAGLPLAFHARLNVIDQSNFGGAGGFTRGLLAAKDIPGATHALLMDDDVVMEPEALRRAQAFFTIARPRHVLGGHMLDMLRPTYLYEAGARVDMRKWYLERVRADLPLSNPSSLDALSRPEPMHYNGWWFFGLPLGLLDEVGLPLPCFIRGDDVEYGLRLHGMGVPIVGMPGAAVWHEPFYVKLNGWQLYYETRNMLIAAAVHFPKSSQRLTVLLFKRLLIYLLTYRYYSAALVLQAIRDYLQGPSLLAAQPQALHASLNRHQAEFPPEDISCNQVVPCGHLSADPKTSAEASLQLAAALVRNWVQPSEPIPPPLRIEERSLAWFRVARLNHIVIDAPWDLRFTVFRRSRPAFRRLLAQGAQLLFRVARRGDAVAEAWRQAQPELTGPGFWRGYLGLTGSNGKRDQPVGLPQMPARQAEGQPRLDIEASTLADRSH